MWYAFHYAAMIYQLTLLFYINAQLQQIVTLPNPPFQIVAPPPPPSLIDSILEPSIFIPIVVLIMVFFVFIILLVYYCNAERAQAIVSVISSIGNIITGKKEKKDVVDTENVTLDEETKNSISKELEDLQEER